MYSYLGIDIGKSGLTISWPEQGKPFKSWPVLDLTYKTDPDWWRKLIALIAPDAIVVAEPTGWHYLAPVVTVLETWCSADLWLVNNDTSAGVRKAYIASAKTDAMDARTLAKIARDIGEGEPPLAARQHNVALEQHVQRLRLLVNTHTRLTKLSVRTQNQTAAFGHALWPELAIRMRTWLGLVAHDIITPRQIKAFAAQLKPDPARHLSGQRIRFIKTLADNLPDIDSAPATVQAIREIQAQQRDTDLKLVELEQHIATVIHQPPFAAVTARWQSIPRGSPIWIAALHVASHGLAELLPEDAFKSMVGQSPRTYRSGSIDKTHASKTGYRPALGAIYMWAVTLCHPDAPPNPVGDYHRVKQDFAATRAKLAKIISAVARSPDGYHYVRSAGSPPADQGQKPQEE